jgi:hypothetical protein
VYRDLTVAHIREPEGADHVEVLFLQSARIYELRRSHPSFDPLLERLHAARAEQRVVTVRLASPDGDVVEDVEVS